MPHIEKVEFEMYEPMKKKILVCKKTWDTGDVDRDIVEKTPTDYIQKLAREEGLDLNKLLKEAFGLR